MFYKISFLKNFAKFTQKYPYRRRQARNFTKKETPTQVFFYEFHEIFKNTFFTERLQRLLRHMCGQ